MAYAGAVSLFLDSFWRAVAYCVHPRVIALSLLPLALMVALAWLLGWLYWDTSVAAVAAWLESSSVMSSIGSWLQGLGLGGVRTALAPFILVVAVTPVIVLVSLVVVAVLMGPSLVSLVAERRFPQLERKKGGSLLVSIFWSLGSMLLAVIALVLSTPLWLIPPLILILPPLIWGWLTYRVMSFDALADHASREERREVLKRHRTTLLGIGVLTGYLGAAPSLVWASGVLFAAAFVVLVPVAIWIYTLVFAFSSLWFSHYCLAALEKLRAEQVPAPPVPTPSPVPLAIDNAQPPVF